MVSIIDVAHAYLAQMFHMYYWPLWHKGRGRFVSLLISAQGRWKVLKSGGAHFDISSLEGSGSASYSGKIWRYTCSVLPEPHPPPVPPSLILEKELSLKVAQAGCQAADNSADSGVKRHRKPRKTKGWWWHGRQMTLLDLLMSFPFYFHAQGTPAMETLMNVYHEGMCTQCKATDFPHVLYTVAL